MKRHSHPQAKTVVDAVVFDLGRVLVSLDWNRALLEARRWCGLAPDEIERRLVSGTLVESFETGVLSPREFHAEAQRRLGGGAPFEEFCAQWCSIFTGEIEPTTTWARRLHRSRHARVAILSNTNAIHAPFLRQALPLLTELEDVFFSHEIGLRKPDAAAYRHVLARLGLPPERVGFVDDLAENVTAAEALGLRGAVAHDPAAVGRALRAWGFHPEDGA